MIEKEISTDVKNNEGSFLGVWQEGCGVLKKVAIDDAESSIFLHFESGMILLVPVDSKIDFYKMIGKRICIVHTDQKKRPYLVIDGVENA